MYDFAVFPFIKCKFLRRLTNELLFITYRSLWAEYLNSLTKSYFLKCSNCLTLLILRFAHGVVSLSEIIDDDDVKKEVNAIFTERSKRINLKSDIQASIYIILKQCSSAFTCVIVCSYTLQNYSRIAINTYTYTCIICIASIHRFLNIRIIKICAVVRSWFYVT